MLKKILSVSGWTLISRITGFARDLVLAAMLGAGMLMDVLSVANRLPNHFRAIFAEGAFNAAFIPAYARVLMGQNVDAARRFAGMIGIIFVLMLLLLTIVAVIFMPVLVSWLAPGFVQRPETFALAVSLTRITFPYLMFVSLVTLISAVLNSHERFVAAAAAPVLLNLSIIAALLIVGFLPTHGSSDHNMLAYGAAWGVTIAGILELILVIAAAARARILPKSVFPELNTDVRGFFKTLAPATLGSMGTQVAMFMDTILVTFLAVGGASALYYADRLYQLPLGVIGIAVGTVVLPHMSRLLANGDEQGARRAQNRAMSFALVLAMPCVVICVLTPQLLFEALFMRGAFDLKAAQSAASVLSAYAVGLPAVVIIRSIVASFYARQDTTRPVIASLIAIGVNVALKLALMPSYGAAGLAFSTAIGAWVNVIILYMWGLKRGWIRPDKNLLKDLSFALVSAVAMAGVVLQTVSVFAPWILHKLPILLSLFSPSFVTLCIAGCAGMSVYGSIFLVLRKYTQRT